MARRLFNGPAADSGAAAPQDAGKQGDRPDGCARPPARGLVMHLSCRRGTMLSAIQFKNRRPPEKQAARKGIMHQEEKASVIGREAVQSQALSHGQLEPARRDELWRDLAWRQALRALDAFLITPPRAPLAR